MKKKLKNMGDVPSRFLKTLDIEDQLDAIQDMSPEMRAKMQRAINASLTNAAHNGNEDERVMAQRLTKMF